MSSCSRRQPRWDSRPSNNRHARPRRMPEARLTTKLVRACSKMLRPSVTQVKSTLPPIKTILIAKSDLLAELSASSLKRAGVCGTFRKFLASVRGVCGTFRKLTQVCGAFAEVSASFSQVCGAFAEVSASSLKCAGRLRKFPQASRKCAGHLRKFPQANSNVRGVCGSFRKPLQRAARLRKFPQASHYCAACLRTVQKVAADAQNDGNDYPNFSFCKPGVDNKKFFL